MRRIFFILGLLAQVCLAQTTAESRIASTETGYWSRQGDAVITFGPDGRTREWVAQGATIQILDYSAHHVTVTESGSVGGGFNTVTWRSEWSPPDKIIPNEVIGVSVKATVTSLSYERPEWPWTFEVPHAQFQGLGGPIMVIANEDIKATVPGQSRVTSNSSVKASAGNGGAAKLNFAIPCRYSHGVQVAIPYVWVDGVATSAADLVVNPAPDGSIIKFIGSTSYQLFPNVVINLPVLHCQNPSGWRTGTLKLTLWATQQGAFQGGAVTGFRLAETNLGTLNGSGQWEAQKIDLGKIAPPPGGRYNVLFTIEERTVNGWVLENWVNYPGMVDL